MNKTVLITGATSGIGLGCARKFAENGDRVILTGRNELLLENIRKELADKGVQVLTLVFDVRDREKAEQCINSLPAEWRDIDVLVNNAGLALGLEPEYEGNLDEWETMIDTNIKGLLTMTRLIVPRMIERNRGHVINVGSVAGDAAYAGGNVYCATKAAVKALTDVVVTSTNARHIVEQLPTDTPIIFGPDRNLGSYINAVTGRNMLLWNGACHVHEQFSVEAIVALKKQYPDAKVLAHPECKSAVLTLADVVGSTQALLNYAVRPDSGNRFIVATEAGILHQMQKKCPAKEFIPVPPEVSEGSIGCMCNECKYMRLNTLEKIYICLRDETNEIKVEKSVAEKAIRPIRRMLEMSK